MVAFGTIAHLEASKRKRQKQDSEERPTFEVLPGLTPLDTPVNIGTQAGKNALKKVLKDGGEINIALKIRKPK